MLALVSTAGCGSAPALIPVGGPPAGGAGALSLGLGGDTGGVGPADVVPGVDGVEPGWDATIGPDVWNPLDQIPMPDEVLPGFDAAPGWDTVVPVDTASPPVDTASPPDCPVAVITVAEGDEVIPQTLVHLSGEESHSPLGTIVSYAWEVVDHPMGCPVFLVPSAQVAAPTVELNCAGSYVFQLTVWDELGVMSCNTAKAKVIVVPCCGGFHIELLWDTPGDPDQTDEGPEAGSDLDLHLLHPFAQGWDADGDGIPDGWFDQPWDCFWFNPHPEWGSIDPAADDNPSLDRDDTDGLGPENINLNDPEPETYRVGVHYWDDHKYGLSSVTVRVYFMGMIVWENAGVILEDKDLWEVCTIEGATGQVTAITDENGQPLIRPDFQHPDYFGP